MTQLDVGTALPRVDDAAISLPSIAVPTVSLWFGAVALWTAATAVVLSDLSRWWLLFTIPAHAAVTYAMFTVAHDSIHGSVGQARWCNELFGRLAVPFVALWVTFPVLRYIHLEHHRHTNEDPLVDPDAWAHSGPRWQLPLRWLTIDAWYSRFCLPRMRHRPPREQLGLWTSEALVVVLAGWLVARGHGVDILVIYLIPQRIGLAILAWWFDWLPHHDLGVTGRVNAFGASRIRLGAEWLMNPLLCYQNYHVVHHIHPGFPFYLWMKLWRRDEADYLDRGVPITTAWGRELTASEYRIWRGSGTFEGTFDETSRPTHPSAATLATLVVSHDGVTEQTALVGDESLLEAALRADIDVPYSCLGGRCTDCKAKLLLGNVHTTQDGNYESGDTAQRWILTCQSRPASDVVHIVYGD